MKQQCQHTFQQMLAMLRKRDKRDSFAATIRESPFGRLQVPRPVPGCCLPEF